MRVPLDAAIFQFQAVEWGGKNPRMHQGASSVLYGNIRRIPAICLLVCAPLARFGVQNYNNVYKGVIAAGRQLNVSPPRREEVRSGCLRKLLENPLRSPIISLSRIILSVADESLCF
jgi:hypothetical protein